MSSDEELLAFIKEKGTVRWTDMLNEFVKKKRCANQTFVNRLGKLQRWGKVGKKLDEKTKRPVYYVPKEHLEEAEKAVVRERIRVNQFIPRIKIKVDMPKPIIGSVGFLAMANESKINSIIMDLNEPLCSKLGSAIKKNGSRRDLGNALLSLINLYSEFLAEEVGLSATYLESSRTIFYVGRFPQKDSKTMRKIVERGLIKNYYELLKSLMYVSLHTWKRVMRKMQDPEFLKGKGLVIPIGLYYDPDEKKLKPLRIDKKMLREKLVHQIEHNQHEHM